MKFNCSVVVNRPIQEVAALFANPKYLAEYQDGFIRKELISGTEGAVDAVSMMYYKVGKQEMELEETVLINNLPDEFRGRYHHKHMDNTMLVSFTDLGNEQTEYYTEVHYTAFRGLMPRMMAFLFPGAFKKQVQKWLDNFKVFAESGKGQV